LRLFATVGKRHVARYYASRRFSRDNEINAKTLLAGATIALALTVAAATPADATKIINLTPVYPGTITGSVPYPDGVSGSVVDFKFTIAAPYHFTFTETGSGGTFLFPISITSTGQAGKYTETFGPFPVTGTLDYSLTTGVPEPATWALMMVGFGLAGASMRRRARVQATA
jgi:hypothetical protein